MQAQYCPGASQHTCYLVNVTNLAHVECVLNPRSQEQLWNRQIFMCFVNSCEAQGNGFAFDSFCVHNKRPSCATGHLSSNSYLHVLTAHHTQYAWPWVPLFIDREKLRTQKRGEQVIFFLACMSNNERTLNKDMLCMWNMQTRPPVLLQHTCVLFRTTQ